MQNMKTKLTSRKFIMAVVGVLSGIMLILTGNSTEGTASIITSVIGYLAAEGLVDMKAVKKAMEDNSESIAGSDTSSSNVSVPEVDICEVPKT